MATINKTDSKLSRGCHLWTWSGLGQDDDGEVLTPNEGCPAFADKTVQITGTFDTTTILIEGSNDGTNWVTLRAPDGSALSFTAAGLQAILENPSHIRPRISAGGASTDIEVRIVGRAIIQLF